MSVVCGGGATIPSLLLVLACCSGELCGCESACVFRILFHVPTLIGRYSIKLRNK